MAQPHRYKKGMQAPYTWSTRFELEERLPKDEIISTLGSLVAQKADSYQPISGMVLGSGAPLRQSVLLGLDPSRTFGTPPTQTCERLADEVQHATGWNRQVDNISLEMRVFMGLRPGYDAEAEAYTMLDLQRLIAARNIGQCITLAGDVFSLRYVDERVRSYVEPGAAVYAPAESLDDVLHIARVLGQARVVAETFGTETQVYE